MGPRTSRSTKRSKAKDKDKGDRTPSPRPPSSRRPAWGVFVYLAGDNEWGGRALRDDLGEILKVGASPEVDIFAQYDGPEGASRYIVPSESSETASPTATFERLDSGDIASLLDFLRWGFSQCDADRIALVIGSPMAVSPGESQRDSSNVNIFALAHDQASNNYLQVADLAGAIREALQDAGRRRMDVLAIDSCHVQFLELAYELEDIVHVLIAPQTMVPIDGWDYERVLGKWKAMAATSPPRSTPDVARALIEQIGQSYGIGSKSSVSALDLQGLDDVALAFDTLCIATLQAMGEGLIWTSRELLLDHLKMSRGAPVYDCGSFFVLWGATLDAMADESYQGWLGTTLKRSTGHSLDRFFEAVARHLEKSTKQAATVDEPVASRMALMIAALRSQDRAVAGKELLDDIGAGVRRRLTLLGPSGTEAARKQEEADAEAREKALKSAITKAFYLLSPERQFDLDRLVDAAESARRLAAQSTRAEHALLGDATREMQGMVLATQSEPAESGWPRWSGVSMYRPSNLNDLMNAGYQRFKFHRRVHWAAMLGAANLIADHPRALWRLVSSMLATGSAVTRRDLLRRLTGEDSVIWGLRDQFQVMAPAPTLTMSLEKRARIMTGDVKEPRRTENYLLRLESLTRGAVVTEQESRVQPKAVEGALHELNNLLQRDVMTTRSLADLRSIGGLLGEDILQALGRALEDDRAAALTEFPDATPHLQLQIPRELMQYPWELMQHRGEWFGERYAIGRQVFMETGLSRRVPSRRPGRVRPLVVGDPVFDESLKWRQLPGARREAEQVAEWFERSSSEVGSVIDFNRRRDTRIHCRLTRADMRSLLRDGDYDIVHFAGHGVFHAEEPETSAWLLSDGELWSLEIRNTLAELPAPPWLVYANACQAGMDAARPSRGYHDNVFGLATAFINQGVAAYIGPLWPIDDLLAQRIALEFYRQLLFERSTLGEALRCAKVDARQISYPTTTDDPDDTLSVWAGLGWASLVLYGDPTAELFQALAGSGRRWRDRPSATRDAESVRTGQTRPARPTPVPVAARPGGSSVLHAPDQVVSQWVRGPNWKPVPLDRRDALQTSNGDVILELIEDAGVRRWRTRTGDGGTRGAAGEVKALPGSKVAALLEDDRVRAQLPSKRGVLRVVGRWVISGFNDGFLGLAREYDREQVPDEQLLADNRTTGKFDRAVGNGVRLSENAVARDRALLLVHGTFSKTASPVEGFGPEFMAWARQQYGVVLGLDHWTLSKTPDENAQLLVDELRAFNPALLKRGALDVITHSRGGLVGRSFCELLNHADAVRNLIFLGTPNCGTDLANPRNWGSFADLLVNMTAVQGAEVFGKLAGLLAQLAATGVTTGVPGLLAQSPESAVEKGSFLQRLQDPVIDRRKIGYGVICAEFEPAALVPNFKQMIKAAAEAGMDQTVDALFDSANDLVVNTSYAWAIGCEPSKAAELPKFLKGDRVLVFTPPRTKFEPPKGTAVETAFGVHHLNLFSQARVQQTIKTWLTQN